MFIQIATAFLCGFCFTLGAVATLVLCMWCTKDQRLQHDALMALRIEENRDNTTRHHDCLRYWRNMEQLGMDHNAQLARIADALTVNK